MKVLAIGATGFLGKHVVQQLLLQGHEVAVFHRGNTVTHELESIVSIYGNRDNLPNFKAEFEHFAPDVVLDLIPYTQNQAEQVVQVFSGCARRIVAICKFSID